MRVVGHRGTPPGAVQWVLQWQYSGSYSGPYSGFTGIFLTFLLIERTRTFQTEISLRASRGNGNVCPKTGSFDESAASGDGRVC